MNEQILDNINDIFSKKRNIVLIPHSSPDADALGSCLALYHFFIDNNNVNIISPNEYTDILNFLPGSEDVIVYENDKEKSENLFKDADVIFTLDFNSLGRARNLSSLISESSAKIIMIDHHENPDNYANIMISDSKMSSTCEMVYNIIKDMDPNGFTPDISECLYTGIMTDTGSFRYPATTPATHRAIAHLIETGASGTEIHQRIYDSASFSRLKLLGLTLSNLKQIPNLPVVYMTLSQKELNSCDYKKGDTEGFVNYGLSLEGIIFSCIMIENENEGIIKISFRSQGEFSVNDFARSYFNGGGHHNAAGGMSSDSIETTVARFIESVQEVAHKF